MPKESDGSKTLENNQEAESRVTKSFINVLAIISILGFIGIVSSTLFNYNIEGYIESLWLMFMGIGFLHEAHPIKLMIRIRSEFKEQNFTALTTLTVGTMAFVAGILTLPQVGIINPALESIKGVISIIAIVFIIVQTWVIK